MNEVYDISIIVPCYKRIEKLDRALSSIKTACSLNYEVIVIDDCPEATSFEVVRKHGAKYYHKAGRERGLPKSRNIGIKLSKGRYILFLDDDDFLLENSVDRLYSAMGKSVTFAYGSHIFLRQDGIVPNKLNELTYSDLLVANQLPVGGYLIDKSTISNLFDEQLRSHEDWDFILSNVVWPQSKYVDENVVVIDQTENVTTSHQARRRSKFWLDYLYIYTRHPAPMLMDRRKDMLLSLGVNLGSTDINN